MKSGITGRNQLQNATLNLLDKSLRVLELGIAQKSITDYGRQLRGAVRGLWNGSIDVSSFIVNVSTALERAFEKAWTEGARTQGIEPGERTPQEQAKLDEMIFEQSGFIPGFAEYVQAHLKADDFKLATAQARTPMWTNRYRDVRTTAELMAGADTKRVWVLGPTEHCSSCLKLAGKVKRNSFWLSSGILPRNPNLECGGWNCLCELRPTNARASAGRLPSIP